MRLAIILCNWRSSLRIKDSFLFINVAINQLPLRSLKKIGFLVSSSHKKKSFLHLRNFIWNKIWYHTIEFDAHNENQGLWAKKKCGMKTIFSIISNLANFELEKRWRDRGVSEHPKLFDHESSRNGGACKACWISPDDCWANWRESMKIIDVLECSSSL